MLKRDLDGFRAVLDDIAASPEIDRVMAVNPDHVVRFGDAAAPFGTTLTEPLLDHAVARDGALTTHAPGADGSRLLRSVTAVRNGMPGVPRQSRRPSRQRLPCPRLFGRQGDHRRPPRGAGAGGSEGGGHAGGFGCVWLRIRRTEEPPLGRLSAAVRPFRDGATDARADMPRTHEIAELGQSAATLVDDPGRTLAGRHAPGDRLEAVLDAIPTRSG